MSSKGLAIILVLTLLALSHVQAAVVVPLTDGNFEELTADGKWLIDFYAPWCPHCQNLEPVFETAATTISLTIPGVKLGSVDCTVETGLAERFGIEGYPSILYFRKGLHTDYEGGREVQDFVRFAKTITGPAVTVITTKDEVSLLKKSPVSFILFYNQASDLECYISLAEKYQDTIRFAATQDRSLLARVKTNQLALLWLNDGETDEITFDSGFDASVAEPWIVERKLPRFPSLDATSWKLLVSRHKPIVLAAMESKDKSSKLAVALKELSSKASGFSFGWLDSTQFNRFLNQYIGSTPTPTFFVLDAENQIHWVNETIKHNVKSIPAFLAAIEAGEVQGQGAGTGVWGKLSMVIANLLEEPIYLAVVCVVFFLLVIVAVCLISSAKTEDEAETNGTKSPVAPASPDASGKIKTD